MTKKSITKTFKIWILRISNLFVIWNLLFVIFSRPATAQTFDLSISPPLLEVMIKPGKTITQAYQLTNSGPSTEVTPTIVLFTPSDEKGHILISDKTYQLTPVNFSLQNSGIEIGKPFTISTNQTIQLVLKVSIPPQAEENDYYFSFLLSTKPSKISQNTSVSQAGIIGTNLLVTITKDGQPISKGEIAKFEIRNLKFEIMDSLETPDFRLLLRNTGKNYWKPFGEITIQGPMGQKWNQEILPENILTNSLRQVQVSTPSASKPGFIFGKFTAKVQFNLDEEKQGTLLTSQITFVAIPYKALSILIWGLAFTSLVKIVLRKINNKVKTKKT
jgi:hypothetical protein